MDTLLTLKQVVEENEKKCGPDMTSSLENSILSKQLMFFLIFNLFCFKRIYLDFQVQNLKPIAYSTMF